MSRWKVGGLARRSRSRSAWLAFLLVCLLSLSLLHSRGTADVRAYWNPWLQNQMSLGAAAGYAENEGDYPPLAVMLLWATPGLESLFGVSTLIAFKLSLYLLLLTTSVVFVCWTKNVWLTSALQILVTLNCMGLGYIDIFLAPAVLLALWAFQRDRPAVGIFFFSLACMIKWQPVLLAPFVLVHVLQINNLGDLKRVGSRRAMSTVALPSLMVFVPLLAIFGLEIPRSFLRATQHAFLSGHALNANWVLTHALHVFDPEQFKPLQDGLAGLIKTTDIRVTLLPRLVFFATYGFTLVAHLRSDKSLETLCRCSLAGFLAYFTFNTGVHENHLFLPVLLAVVLYSLDRQTTAVVAGVGLVANVNLFLFYGINGEMFRGRLTGMDLALPLSILTVLLFGALYLDLLKTRRPPAAPSRAETASAAGPRQRAVRPDSSSD